MSINTSEFYDLLEGCGVEFYTGVPDSLLKDFCLCVDDRVPGDKHIIAANEGNAIALAAGYYLANKSIPLVYMQNSGLGNAVNPLLSLCDPEVYSIPMLLMIGWRGEPGVKDEPQHIKQGKIQLDLLDTLNVPYVIISKDDKSYASKVSSALTTARNEDRPVALLMRKGVFEIYGAPIPKVQNHQMLREEALEVILDRFLPIIFPGYSIFGKCTFRILRNSDLELEEEAEDLVREFETALKKRRRGDVVSLTISKDSPKELFDLVTGSLSVLPEEIIQVEGVIGMTKLSELVISDKPNLLWKPFKPRNPERVEENNGDIFATIKRKDMYTEFIEWQKSQNINEDINNEVSSFYENKVILITGGGGSIGKEICYKIQKIMFFKLSNH